MSATKSWNVIDRERGLLWREYEFRKGAYATTFVFRGTDGLVVVSPGRGMESADYDALSELGEVRALIANNTFHHLGQAPWRARFPNAISYASGAAVAKLRKKVPEAVFQPIEDLALPSHVRAHVLPGFRNGELMFTVGSPRGNVWYSGDLLTNIQRTPGPPLSWLFKYTDSGPGYRLFRLGVWLFVNDKAAVKERMRVLVADEPPAIVVPGHGPAVFTENVAAETKTQIEKL